MAVLLLVMVMLISGGCQNMHHLSANQTGKDDADTGTGYNIYYINSINICQHFFYNFFIYKFCICIK